MILVKKNLTWIFLENAPTYSQGSTVYQKNKNNFVEGFVVGENGQKYPKISKIFTFGSTFEIHRIGRSVSYACKFFQIFEFSTVF